MSREIEWLSEQPTQTPDLKIEMLQRILDRRSRAEEARDRIKSSSGSVISSESDDEQVVQVVTGRYGLKTHGSSSYFNAGELTRVSWFAVRWNKDGFETIWQVTFSGYILTLYSSPGVIQSSGFRQVLLEHR